MKIRTTMETEAGDLDISRPLHEYRQRLAEQQKDLERERHSDLIFSVLRFVVFLGGIGLLIWAFSSDAIPVAIVGAPVVCFVVLVIFHGRCRRAIEHAMRRVKYYENGLKRLEGDWEGRGETGRAFAPESHLYAEDLDIFGRGSLFELVCAAGTGVGQDLLASWLSTPADAETVELRQGAVRELSGRLDLREDLALSGLDLDAKLAAGHLMQWAEAPAPLARVGLRVAATTLSLLTAIALGLWAFTPLGLFPFVCILAIQFAFTWRIQNAVQLVVRNSGEAAAELRVLARLLRRLETESFEDARLGSLKQKIQVEGHPPSEQVERLVRRVDILDQLTHNQLLTLVAIIFMGIPQAAMAIEAWRNNVGRAIGGWLSAVAEIEAIASLARFAFENPDYTYPEVVKHGAQLEAEALAHPMLPRETRVANDIRLDRDQQLLLLSGSNMSGKSTLLRSIGVNAVLALAGAPVCAGRLIIGEIQIGASIRVQDSLMKGSSRFYAEISRIRDIVSSASGSRPLLFLLDEIFGGTNSQDRRIGAAAVIRSLVQQGAVGVITTHDLALSSIAEELGDRAINVHFEDDFKDGKIFFDYRLKPGLLKKGNALALMRSVGLEV